MNVDTVSLFLALLALAAEVGAVALLVALAARSRGRAVIDAVGPNGLGLAAAVACTATAGSLYFSEVAHFTPCNLCWYQRICMYPLAVILTIAAVRRDHGITPYAAALAGIGAAIAGYHVLLERFPTLESDICDPANPCTLIWVERLGYLTIPTMALSGFVAIAALLAADHAAHSRAAA